MTDFWNGQIKMIQSDKTRVTYKSICKEGSSSLQSLEIVGLPSSYRNMGEGDREDLGRVIQSTFATI
jgi:hypothetical protein